MGMPVRKEKKRKKSKKEKLFLFSACTPSLRGSPQILHHPLDKLHRFAAWNVRESFRLVMHRGLRSMGLRRAISHGLLINRRRRR